MSGTAFRPASPMSRAPAKEDQVRVALEELRSAGSRIRSAHR